MRGGSEKDAEAIVVSDEANEGHGRELVRALTAGGADVEPAVLAGRGHHPEEVELAVRAPAQVLVGHRLDVDAVELVVARHRPDLEKRRRG